MYLLTGRVNIQPSLWRQKPEFFLCDFRPTAATFVATTPVVFSETSVAISNLVCGDRNRNFVLCDFGPSAAVFVKTNLGRFNKIFRHFPVVFVAIELVVFSDTSRTFLAVCGDKKLISLT